MAPSALSPSTGNHVTQPTTNGKPHHVNGKSDGSTNTEVKSPLNDVMKAIETIQQTFESALATITTSEDGFGLLRAENTELKTKVAILEAEKIRAEKSVAKAGDDLAREKTEDAEQIEKLQILASSFTTQYETFKAAHESKYEENKAALLEIQALRQGRGEANLDSISLAEELILQR